VAILYPLRNQFVCFGLDLVRSHPFLSLYDYTGSYIVLDCLGFGGNTVIFRYKLHRGILHSIMENFLPDRQTESLFIRIIVAKVLDFEGSYKQDLKFTNFEKAIIKVHQFDIFSNSTTTASTALCIV
jgi:hypothetical protein